MPSPLRSSAAVLVAVAALALSSCGSDDPAASDTPEPTPSASDAPSPTGSGTATSGPTPSETASAPPTSDAPAPNSLEALLPTAEELPGLNDGWRWNAVGTEPAADDPFGVCAPVGMMTIGAERGVLRRYAPVGGTGGRAEAMALQFPDRTNTRRALEVLRSLHDRCRQRLRDQGAGNPNLTPPRQIPTGSDVRAWWYLARFVPEGADTGRFHSFGVVAGGDRMVVLTIDVEGQDHSYPPGEEPMAEAVELVAGLFPDRG